MTSRRYSELNNISNMSMIDEVDENSAPRVDGNSTPRSKLIPAKKSRISGTPLAAHQSDVKLDLEETLKEQKAAIYKVDGNLEETFMEETTLEPDSFSSPQSRISDTPLAAHQSDVKLDLEETLKEQEAATHKVDKNLEETFMEKTVLEPDSFSSPQSRISDIPLAAYQSDVKLDLEGTLKEHKADTNKVGGNLEETFMEEATLEPESFSSPQSRISDTPLAAHPGDVKLDLEETLKEQEADNNKVGGNLEETFMEEATLEPESFSSPQSQISGTSLAAHPADVKLDLEEAKKEQVAVTHKVDENLEKTFMEETVLEPDSFSSPQKIQSNSSVLGTSLMSFMETEMEVHSEENCKCERFQSILKEYTVLKTSFSKTEVIHSTVNTEQPIEILEQLEKITLELCQAKMEAEGFKKKAENASKDVEDFQFALDEEKRRSKARMADLQKYNFELADKLEALAGENVQLQKALEEKDVQHSHFIAEQRLEETFFNQMKAVLEEEKQELEKSVVEKDLEILESEKKTAKLEEEFNQMKVVLEKEKKELEKSVVEKDLESEKKTAKLEEEFNQMKAVLEKEKKELEKSVVEKDLEILESEKKTAKLEEELGKLNKKIEKLYNDLDAADYAQKESAKMSKDIQFALDEEKRQSKARMADLQKNNFDVADKLETLAGENVQLQKALEEKDAQHSHFIAEKRLEAETFLNHMKAALEKEKKELEKSVVEKDLEILETEKKTAKLEEELGKLNKKIEKLYNDLDAADYAQKESAELIFQLNSKLSKLNGTNRVEIDLAQGVYSSPEMSFKSFVDTAVETSYSNGKSESETPTEDHEECPSTPSQSTSKRSFGSKIASPFRKKKADQSCANQ